MLLPKNIQHPLLSFIVDTIKPFRWFIAGQFTVAVIWAVDMSLRPYLSKVILNSIQNIVPSQAFEILAVPVGLCHGNYCCYHISFP